MEFDFDFSSAFSTDNNNNADSTTSSHTAMATDSHDTLMFLAEDNPTSNNNNTNPAELNAEFDTSSDFQFLNFEAEDDAGNGALQQLPTATDVSATEALTVHNQKQLEEGHVDEISFEFAPMTDDNNAAAAEQGPMECSHNVTVSVMGGGTLPRSHSSSVASTVTAPPQSAHRVGAMAPPSPLPPKQSGTLGFTPQQQQQQPLVATPTKGANNNNRRVPSFPSISQPRAASQSSAAVSQSNTAPQRGPRLSDEATKKITALHREADALMVDTEWATTHTSRSLRLAPVDAALQAHGSKQQATLQGEAEAALSAAATLLFETFTAAEVLSPHAGLAQGLQLKPEPLPLMLANHVIPMLKAAIERAL